MTERKDHNTHYEPHPGSELAVHQGCTCPVSDNGRGRGYMGGVKDKDGKLVFIIRGGCPLHDKGMINNIEGE